MSIKNKVVVNLWLEDDCDKDTDGPIIHWSPMNFSIYNKLFIDMIYETVDQWVSENEMITEKQYELILQHIVEYDGAGACTGEHFEILNVEKEHIEVRYFD